MTTVGYASLQIIPSFKGFGTALTSGMDRQMVTAGTSASGKFSSSFKSGLATVGKLGGLAAALGIGAVLKSSVSLEAEFSKTMNTMAAVASLPAAPLAELSDLAITMGRDTVFSANDAATAMLELAKNGIPPATIQAGALKSALTLAAASGVGMGEAATIMGNSLNAFNLNGGKASEVAAALAGAANASSADIASLAQGLQQASTVAADTGLSVQETTAALAAFSNAGIAGSDAGTSLKTMLQRLVPQSKIAGKAFEIMNLGFTKSDGSFKNLAGIADELREKFGKMSAEERAVALNTTFGSDARRAATILMNEGAEGVRKYIAATSDQKAADRTAAAAMKGTAGAIEQLKGSWETVRLQMGKFLAPLTTTLLTGLAGALNGLGPMASLLQDKLAPAFEAIGRFITGRVVPGFKALAGFVKRNSDLIAPLGAVLGGVAAALLIVAAATKAWAIAQGLLNLVMTANPITLVVLAIGALAAGLVIAYKRSETFRDIVASALEVVSAGVSAVSSAFSAMWSVVQPIITAFVTYIQQNWGGIVGYLGDVFGTLKDIVAVALASIASIVSGKLAAVKASFTEIVGGIKATWAKFGDNITTVVRGAFQVVTGIVRGALDVIRGVLHTVLAVITGDWSGAWNGLKEIVGGVWTAIKASVIGGLTIIKGLMGAAWTAIKVAASAAWAGIRDDVTAKFDKIIETIKGVPSRIAGLAGSFLNAGKAIIDGLISGISSATGFVTGIAGSIWNVLKGLINDAIDQINAALEFDISVPGPVPDIPINAPDIPRLAKGGIVTRPTLALIGEDGPEAVVPLARQRPSVAGGVTITVENMHVASYSDMMSQLQHRVRGAALGGAA